MERLIAFALAVVPASVEPAAPARPGAPELRAPAAAEQGAAAWTERWDQAERLMALEAAAPEFVELERRLRATAAAVATDSRAVILGRVLAAARGDAPAPATDAEQAWVAASAWPFDRRASWIYAGLAPSQALRLRAVQEGLAREPGGQRLGRPALLVAWRTGTEEAGEFRLESALRLQRELYERYREPWSSMDLALTLTWSSHIEEALRVLTETIDIERTAGRPTSELLSRRGLVHLGAGDERRGRDDLGRALAAGSANAAVVLARLDLDRGARRRARVGFRSLVATGSPGAWALRGWGLSLLQAEP